MHIDIKGLTYKMSPSATNGAGTGSALSWDTFTNIIDGKAATTKNTRNAINPATEEPSSTVPVATEEDVDRAMEAAERAFGQWAAVPYAKRQQAVKDYADALEAEKENFAALLTREQGKPVSLESSSV